MQFKGLFPERDEVLLRGWAPVPIRRLVTKVGGMNPYGEKNYRIVLAQSVYEWHGGHWIDWPDDSSLQDMGGMQLAQDAAFRKHIIKMADDHMPLVEIAAEIQRLKPSERKPLRVIDEMRFVQRYPYHEGWMLQCWRPPEQFGSKEWWDSKTVFGRPDLPILGPFPSKGSYEALDHMELGQNGVEVSRTTYPEMPSVTGIEDAIHFLEDQKYREREAASPEARLLIRTHEYEQRLLYHRQKDQERRSMELTELLKPYLGQSLEAGRLRTEVANEAGLSGHFGA